eukprot:12556823-Alexandrium_andersonii.AAC.1
MSTLAYVLGHVALAPDLVAVEPEHLAPSQLCQKTFAPFLCFGLQQAECEHIALALRAVERAYRVVVAPTFHQRHPSLHHRFP